MVVHTCCSGRVLGGRGRKLNSQQSRLKGPVLATWDLVSSKQNPMKHNQQMLCTRCLGSVLVFPVSCISHNWWLLPSCNTSVFYIGSRFLITVVLCCYKRHCNGCPCTVLQVLPKSLTLFLLFSFPHSWLCPSQSHPCTLLSYSFAHCLMKLWSL